MAGIFTRASQSARTVEVAEADDDERVRRRVAFHEPYRTLLGHLRHEIGHYFWDALIARGGEQRLEEFASRDVAVQRYRTVPGVGLLTATALRASAGDLSRFRSGRQFSAWLGLTPREHSSGQQRRLGGLTKRGDVYVRTLLIHGARAVLQAARMKQRRGQDLDPLQAWALKVQDTRGHNKAACALANKLARRLWAMDHHGTPFDPRHVSERPRAA